MISLKPTLALLFGVFLMDLCYAQSALVDNLQKYAANDPQEKVYLHMDKPHYLTGDDIWLKGYVTIGAQNQLSALSKILYVDLIGPDNKVAESLKLLVLHGVAIGDIHLADTLQQGTYHIRAYTNWMRNLPQGTFFNKALVIGRVRSGAVAAQGGGANTSARRNSAANASQPENTTSFMPEGGDMVAGLQCRIAFKMLQPDGLGASGSGYVSDDTGADLADIKPGFAGMGSVLLTPQAGKSYKAVITYADGKKQTVNLPPVLSQGYNLAVMRHSPVAEYIVVKASPEMIKGQKMSLLVQKEGAVIYTGQIVVGNDGSLTKLPLANVPPGVIQVSLFNENMQMVCERLFFNINKNAVMPLAIQTNDSYKTREAVSVTLTAGVAADTMRVGSFSAAVVNLAGLAPIKSNETSILPSLLLDPELKGYVEDPDHYFETTEGDFDANRLAELDNLILCQGWRRIVWDNIKTGKMPEHVFQPERSFSVSGVVTLSNGTPAPGAKVSLLAARSLVGIDTVTDAKGHFVFDNLLLRDSTRMILNAKDKQGGRTLRIKIDQQPALSGDLSQGGIQFMDDASYQNFLRNAYAELPDSVKMRQAGYQALKQVNITAVKDKKKLVPSYSSNINGAGNADDVFLADEMKTSMTLQQFLEGRVMGLRFENGKPYSARSRDFQANDVNPVLPMQVYLDGIRIDQDGGFALNDISVDDVQSIEILRTTATMAVYGINYGVIILTTKTGRSVAAVSKARPDQLALLLQGYHTIREFYSPDHSVSKSITPDHRATIYWKPDLVTDKNGNTSFKFYTSDDKGTYRITIEGVAADGRVAHLVKNITIN